LPFNDFHITKIDQFVNYFNETYLLSSIFPIKLWNHYATTGPRTNNHVEGYNNKLKCFVGAAKPNIFKIVSIFKNEETNSDKKFRKATADPPSKPPPRDTYYADKDVKLKIFKDLFANGGITLDTYWMNISALYEFKKKEKLNDNESSSSSDSEELTSDEEEIEEENLRRECDTEIEEENVIPQHNYNIVNEDNGYVSNFASNLTDDTNYTTNTYASLCSLDSLGYGYPSDNYFINEDDGNTYFNL